MYVQRKLLDGTSTAYTFNVAGLKFLVKNLTESDILVNFEAITDENESTSIKIPSQIAQVVLTNEITHYGYKTIYVKGTGEVEVQVIYY